MKPSQRLVTLGIIWVLLAVAGSIWREFSWLWTGSGILLVVVALVDVILGYRAKNLLFTRILPNRFALGEEHFVKIILRNQGSRSRFLTLFDGVPGNAEAAELPWVGVVEVGRKVEVSYPIRMLQRGDELFTQSQVLSLSPCGLWEQKLFLGEEEEVKVYPNYEPLVEYALLATEQRIEQMGIIRKNRVGMSKEFHQLRDYHQGDSLNQIDWKSSARRLQLISRDYQEQRDQTVILAIDSGRRMRSMDGELSQFDHCLNSMLLLSYIALRQGDKVGVMKFGGKNRWLPPVKGAHQMPTLLNHLYDYDVSLQPSDFREAAEQIMVMQQRRSLVVVLTNLRGEDGGDLTESLAQLRKRHLVVLASLREEAIDDLQQQEGVTSLDDALGVAAAQLYVDERTQVLTQLEQAGIQTIDESAQNLPIALCNRYLDIKSEL